MGRYGVALQPLVDRLAEQLRQRGIIHADETPVRQLDLGEGKTHRAYLWAYRSNDLDEGPPLVVFDYQTGRSGACVRNFLAHWRGSLVVDDYGGYKALFAQGITEVGCMAQYPESGFIWSNITATSQILEDNPFLPRRVTTW